MLYLLEIKVEAEPTIKKTNLACSGNQSRGNIMENIDMSDMIELKFNGPIHFDDIDVKTGKLKTNPQDFLHPNNSGVYIWGFMYDYNKSNKSLGELIVGGKREYNEDTMQFIPYYVGLASGGKSGMTISKRLITHHNVRIGDAAKYKRFQDSFYKEFFKDDSGFNPPITSDKITCKKYYNNGNCEENNKKCPHEFIVKSGALIYNNLPNCLKKIYINDDIPNPDSRGNIPITECIKFFPKEKDTLDLFVNKNNRDNFWAFYAVLDTSEVNEITESFVYWSLKGKTISKILDFKNIEIYKKCYKIRSNIGIFKKVRPSSSFHGYID